MVINLEAFTYEELALLNQMIQNEMAKRPEWNNK